MKALSLLVLTLITACGTAEEPVAKSTATDVADTKGGEVVRGEDDPKATTIEYRKTDATTYALAVDDTKDMPVCERENNKQLVYVKNADKFYSCEENWVEVPIAAKPGVAGVSGEKGDKGDKGEKGDPGAPVSVNQWYDVISTKRWLVNAATRDQNAIGAICTNGWRLPTVVEAQTAMSHGFALGLTQMQAGLGTVWSSEVSYASGNPQYTYVLGTGGTGTALNNNGQQPQYPSTALVVCIAVGD